jgi:hypothetical protein
VGPRASLDSVDKRKSLAPAENRTPAVQPVAIPTSLSRFPYAEVKDLRRKDLHRYIFELRNNALV